MTIVFDILLISVVIGAIIYSIGLNRKINEKVGLLQQSKKEMEICLKNLQDALDKAKIGIGDIRAVGEKIIQDTQGNITKAETLRDEIGFFVDRAEKAIVTLEQRINDAKGVSMSKNTTTPTKTLKREPSKVIPKPTMQAKAKPQQPLPAAAVTHSSSSAPAPQQGMKSTAATASAPDPRPQQSIGAKVGKEALMELLKGVR